MSNQEILDNAPDGATHIDDDELYWMIRDRDSFNWQRKIWLSFSSDKEVFRSIADIKRIAELEEEKLNMQIFITSVMESVGRISVFVENIEPSSHEAVIAFNQCMEICAAIDDLDLPEFEIKGGAE